MDIDTLGISLRVVASCIILAFFVFMPLRSRFRCNVMKTAFLVTLLIGITVAVTILFLIPGQYLSDYSIGGILFWIASAVLVFHLAIRGSCLELVFIVLVVLNLYVNVMTIAKLIMNMMEAGPWYELARAAVSTGVLIAYIPLLYVLLFRLYKRVIELNINLAFWKFIWVIPALTYLIFYIKIVSDYWKGPVDAGTGDVVFSVLWSFSTYVFFWVTLQMLLKAYEGFAAARKAELMTSQLQMQEEQYEKLLSHIESTSRLRHDWRHHLLLLHSLSEKGEDEELRTYLRELLPVYLAEVDLPICQNHVADVILRHYAGIAKEKGIRIEIQADLPRLPAVTDSELCIIFGNLAENAVEACLSQETGERLIEIRARREGSQMILMFKNTYGNQIVFRDGAYASTKHEGSGIGLQSVEKVVEKRQGIMKVEYDGTYFTVYVLLNENGGD